MPYSLELAITATKCNVALTGSFHPIADIREHAKSVYSSLVATKAALVMDGVLTRTGYDRF